MICEILNSENNSTIKILKKRGRKPKILTQIENDPDLNSENVIVPEKIHKKRGRKSTLKLININSDVNYDTICNLVAHLPLQNNDISKIIDNENSILNDEIIENKKNIEYSVILGDVEQENNVVNNKNNYEIIIEELNNEIKRLKNGIIEMRINYIKNIHESKVNFYNKTLNKWEEKTNIACWWCCNSFTTFPLGIPEYIIINKSIFYLFGCFCSFNCMLSYNIDINDSKIWERQANIYQLKNKIDPDNKLTIYPAPPRQVLDMFGGNLSIEEYRKTFFYLNKEYRYKLPTMISLVGVIEEINKDICTKTSLKAKDNYVIKRKTPLQKQLNTLTQLIK